MKKILSIFIFLGLIMLNACDPMEDIYEEIDAKEDYVTADVAFTLTADDYATASGYALKYAGSPTYVEYAEYIEEMEAFNMYFTAEEYVPFILAEKYDVLNKNSVANVTFNYIADLPEELSMYTNTEQFSFTSDQYADVDSLVNITGYLYPDFNPDLYIPGILANSISDPNDDDMLIVSYKYSDVNPIINIVDNTKVLEEDFETATAYETIDINDWSQFIEAGTETWEGRSYGGNTYAQFSAYNSDEASNIAWLITPVIDLSEYSEVLLNFKSKDGYNNGDPLEVYISTDYSGSGDPTSSDWVNLNPTLSTGNSGGYASSWVESGDINLDDYTGGTVYIAFKYTGGDGSVTTTMQIDDVTVTALTAGYEVIGENPYTKKDFYSYDDNNNSWKKVKDVYYLTSKDYDAMGSPGNYDNFSNDDDPRDYIPNLLESMYPTAGEGVSKIVVYKYYTGAEGTLTLADQYTYTNGEWQSLYNYIEAITQQFIHNGTKWVFDPTETYTMKSSDYQIIVDYVKDNFGDDFIDSYGTQEFYYGAGAYYSNFDLRAGKWNSEEFDSWDEAVKEALEKVLLPAVYPNATLQVNGVDMYYRVVFDTYSGSAARYAMKFQVTKAGPDPEFTFSEGPTLL